MGFVTFFRPALFWLQFRNVKFVSLFLRHFFWRKFFDTKMECEICVTFLSDPFFWHNFQSFSGRWKKKTGCMAYRIFGQEFYVVKSQSRFSIPLVRQKIPLRAPSLYFLSMALAANSCGYRIMCFCNTSLPFVSSSTQAMPNQMIKAKRSGQSREASIRWGINLFIGRKLLRMFDGLDVVVLHNQIFEKFILLPIWGVSDNASSSRK